MTPFYLALLNLSRRKIPSLISLAAIAISVACSGILLRLNVLSSSRFDTLARGGDAVIGAKAGGIEILLNSLNSEGPYPDFLPYVLYQSLKAHNPVQFEDQTHYETTFSDAVIPILYFAKFKNYRVIGTDESFLKRPVPDDSPLLLKGRWASGSQEIVLGALVAREQGIKLDDQVPITGWIGDAQNQNIQENFKVVGIFEPFSSAWDHALFSNISEGQRMLSAFDLSGRSIWKNQVLNYFLLYLHPGGMVPLKDLINKRTVGQVISVPEERQKLEDLTGTGKLLGFFVCALVMLLGGLSVAAMMITRFDAMTVQLAVLRAIGYRKGEIGRWLLWEGLLLGLGACLLGGLIDFLFFPLIRNFLGSALPDPTLISSSIFQSSPVWVIAILATTGAIVIPIMRLYRQDVHQSLRGL